MAKFDEIEGARKLLGLGKTATLKEIKSAYQGLAHYYHPDKHGSSPKKNAEMKRLNRAYKLLVDYCSDYQCSFGEEDVDRTYPYDEYEKKWSEKWFDSI